MPLAFTFNRYPLTIVCYRHLNHPIQFVLEYTIGFFNLAQGVATPDEWSSVYLALLNQAKEFLAIATVHTTGLEGEVLAIRFG